jgi:hypothetical protein
MTEMIAGATHVVLAEMTAPQGVTTVADVIHVTVVIPEVPVVMIEMIAGATHVVLAGMIVVRGVTTEVVEADIQAVAVEETTVVDVTLAVADIPEVHVVMTEAEDLVVLVEMIAVVRPSEDVLTPTDRLLTVGTRSPKTLATTRVSGSVLVER